MKFGASDIAGFKVGTGDVSKLYVGTSQTWSIEEPEPEPIVYPDGIQISDWYELNAIRNNLSGDYVLVADLDENTALRDVIAVAQAGE